VHARLGIRSRQVPARPGGPAQRPRHPALSLGPDHGSQGLLEEHVELAPAEAGFQQVLLLLEAVA